MKVRELVELQLASDIRHFYIAHVFDLEEYSNEKHSELEVNSYELRIDRLVSHNTIKESVSMIINPKKE